MGKKLLVSLAIVLNAMASIASAQDIHTADVLIVYSADVVASHPDIAPQIVAMLEYANRALENSDADLRFRLVKVAQVDFEDDGSTDEAALRALTDNVAVADLRRQYGADLVSMVTTTGPYCGIAWLTQGENGELYSWAKDAAYSVVGYDCVSSFAHELGHNLSLHHSIRQNASGGLYPFGRGYGVDDHFATVMSYANLYSAPKVQYFSTPRKTECDELPCGRDRNAADGADAAYVLTAVAPQAAGWFPTVVEHILPAPVITQVTVTP